ncbi:hypothetical protein BGZ60DRAFT_564229 [Tricladium varicosporioides]|nr:hypothetical protein BGZ60DRAFT_564229 [Hymenoscyphus varicosporioides]
MMEDIVSRRNGILPTSEGFQPHTSPSPRQFGGIYHQSSATSSASSHRNTLPVSTGSEEDLLLERNAEGHVGKRVKLPTTTPRLLQQPSHENAPKTSQRGIAYGTISKPPSQADQYILRVNHRAEQDIPQANHQAEQDIPQANRRAEQDIPRANRRAERDIPQANHQAEQDIPQANHQAEQDIPQANHQAEQNIPQANHQANLKEWKSWKIKYPYLSVLLMMTLSLIATIIALDIVSRKNNGFAPLTNAPGFLARDPAVERAIWAQGILYTSFPAFIMTLYRTLWESTVAAFADRQPYVDLNKDKGRPAKATIMLDYKTEPTLWAYVLAFRNGHYLLGLCLLTSTVLGFLVVPLVAFLFTTDTFISSTILPVSILTTFNSGVVFPDFRSSLNTAAAMRLQDARGPPWTDGEFAFPKFIPSTRIGDGNASIETVAYSSVIKCEYMPESNYTKVVIPPGTPGFPTEATTIQITANDRGCEIVGQISVPTISEFPEIPGMPGPPVLSSPQNMLKLWSTLTCSADDGWSRLSILTARQVSSSSGITNFSLISCIPSYQTTSGTLVAKISASSEPSLKNFAPRLLNATNFRPDILWRIFENNMPEFNCFDQLSNVDADEFMRNVYNIAAKRLPDSPLLPEAIIHAASTLWSTTFAVLASTELFTPSSPPMNGTGIYSTEMNRLVVVSPIAYIILSILTIVALLNISLFFYSNQESILLEEPVGLVGAAGILHGSIINKMFDEFVKEPGFDGRIAASMKRADKLMISRYRFDNIRRVIVRYGGVGTPRKSWWKSLTEWAWEQIVSNFPLNRFTRH